MLKFKGIGNRESEIGGSFSLVTYSRCPIPDALDCFESPFVYGLSNTVSFADGSWERNEVKLRFASFPATIGEHNFRFGGVVPPKKGKRQKIPRYPYFLTAQFRVYWVQTVEGVRLNDPCLI